MAAKPGQAPRLSRIEQMKKDRIEPQMPPISSPEVIGWLIDLGLTSAAGFGALPLTWSEIDAWQRVTGTGVEPWMARLLRQLSAEYIVKGREAESENCPVPWRCKATPEQQAAEVRLLDMLLG